jgi:TolB-like protein/Flp pilus assembly protein TadD
MSTANQVWEPSILSPEQVEQVRHHLDEIKASHAFAGSKRTQDFLQLIVEHALHGDMDKLRERMIGVELFGRPVDYDTGNDSVVRVKATEVRKKLSEYYLESGVRPTVRIEIPRGSYVPKFIFEAAEDAAGPHRGAASSRAAEHAIDHRMPPGDADEVVSGRKPRRRRLLPAVAVAVLVLAAVGYIGWKNWHGASNGQSGIRSIAVLPLKNLSGDPQQEYFADGMTEELINDLGQVATLRVISLTSSMSYKGTTKNLPQIAKELGVQGVVEGGVLRDGNQVRISVQLIDVRRDRPIWAHSYIRDLNGALAWQGELAQTIADEISIGVTPQEQARLARRNTVKPEAQDLYLRGIRLREANDCQNAIADFDRAIVVDANYAQAHSALATCYGMLGESGRMPYEDAFSRQKAEAVKAIELDDSLSEAHAELANTAMTQDWDWSTAATQFHRALELNPNSATNHEKYAFYLVRTGDTRDALAEVQRSVDLDPVSSSTFHAEGFIYYFSRQYDQALTITRTVQGLKINLADWNFLIGAISVEKGMYPAAIQAFSRAGGGPYALGHLGNAYARSGQTDAARKAIAQLEEQVRKNGVGRYEIALIYAGLGDRKSAFKWLEDSYRAHDVGLVYLKVDPCLDPLRSDPHFDELLQHIGLTPYHAVAV